MKVTVVAAYAYIPEKDIKDQVVVVIDTLRATSTIVTAIARGARQIVPVREVDEAMEMLRSMNMPGVVLGGERGAQMIAGFDLSNSPRDYTEQSIRDKVLLFTTSNGTAAIHRARSAQKVFIGALINAGAIAQKLVSMGQDFIILCAGTNGKFSIDDAFTSGAIISKVSAQRSKVDLDDLGKVCVDMYRRHQKDPLEIMRLANHGELLFDLGLGDDVAYCAQEDIVNIAPVYSDGLILP